MPISNIPCKDHHLEQCFTLKVKQYIEINQTVFNTLAIESCEEMSMKRKRMVALGVRLIYAHLLWRKMPFAVQQWKKRKELCSKIQHKV